MDSSADDPQELEPVVRDLVARVWRLEQQVAALSPTQAPIPKPPSAHPASAEAPVSVARHKPASSPDLESRISAQWLNRVGIIAVLVGVSFFLKYAFEGGWIGPAGRVIIGIIGGIMVILWSEWFRKREYLVFSYSLKGLGLGVLYISFWAALQVYQLISLPIAAAAMIAVTVTAAVLALWQNAEVLAFFALVGGFATPILLQTRQNHEVQLFSYLLLLDLATLFLAATRAWRRLLLFSLLATFALYWFWYLAFYTNTQRSLTLFFATGFFAIFALAPLLASRATAGPSASVAVLLSCTVNALVYFFELYVMLGRFDNDDAAICALALGGVYLCLGKLLAGTSPAGQRNTLASVHLALGTMFITAAIAIEFSSYWISIAWFAEAAIIMSIGFLRRSAFVRWQALAVIALTIAKVFALDVWRLDREYRILSFVLLGVLLLAVSFLYQRDWLKLSPGRNSNKVPPET